MNLLQWQVLEKVEGRSGEWETAPHPKILAATFAWSVGMWREAILERGWWELWNSVSFYSTAWRGNRVRKHCKKWGHEGFVWGTHVTDFMVRDLGKNPSPLPREDKLLQCSAQELEGRWRASRWVSYQKASMCSRWGLTSSCLGFSRFKWRLIHISKTKSFGGKGLMVWGQHRGEMIPTGSQQAPAGLRKASGWKWHQLQRGGARCQVLCASGLQVQIRHRPHLPGQPGVRVDDSAGCPWAVRC